MIGRSRSVSTGKQRWSTASQNFAHPIVPCKIYRQTRMPPHCHRMCQNFNHEIDCTRHEYSFARSQTIWSVSVAMALTNASFLPFVSIPGVYCSSTPHMDSSGWFGWGMYILILSRWAAILDGQRKCVLIRDYIRHQCRAGLLRKQRHMSDGHRNMSDYLISISEYSTIM